MSSPGGVSVSSRVSTRHIVVEEVIYHGNLYIFFC